MLPAGATHIAGGKGASLARMAAAGLPVPSGFVICTAAFDSFLEHHGALALLAEIAQSLNVDDHAALESESERIQILLEGSAMPAHIEETVRRAYEALGRDVPVAVRSSAVGEDGDAASFAGQQETFLNVVGAEEVTDKVKRCWASFFSPRALTYRAKKGDIA